jgi:tetratricopeptide (TPR) repeat protein
MGWRASYSAARQALRDSDTEAAADHFASALSDLEAAAPPEAVPLAEVTTALGEALALLDRPEAGGVLDLAVQRLEAAHGPDHPTMAPPLVALAKLLLRDRAGQLSMATFERAADLAFPTDKPAILQEAATLAWEHQLWRHAANHLHRLASIQESQGTGDVVNTLEDAASAFISAGAFGEASETLAYAARLSPTVALAARLLGESATALARAGRHDEANQRRHETIKVLEQNGADGPVLASAIENLALGVASSGHKDQALRLCQSALQTRATASGNDLKATEPTWHTLGEVHRLLGDAAGAAQYHARAIAARHGDEQPRYTSLFRAATALANAPDRAEATMALTYLEHLAEHNPEAALRDRALHILAGGLATGMIGLVAAGCASLVRHGSMAPIGPILCRQVREAAVMGAAFLARVRSYAPVNATVDDDIPPSVWRQVRSENPNGFVAHSALADLADAAVAVLSRSPEARTEAMEDDAFVQTVSDHRRLTSAMSVLHEVLGCRPSEQWLVVHPTLRRGFLFRCVGARTVGQVALLASEHMIGDVKRLRLPGYPIEARDLDPARGGEGRALLEVALPWQVFSWPALGRDLRVDPIHCFELDATIEDVPILTNCRVLLLDELERPAPPTVVAMLPVAAEVTHFRPMMLHDVERWVSRILEAQNDPVAVFAKGEALRKRAATLAASGQIAEALEALQDAWTLMRRRVGTDHPKSLPVLEALADTLERAGDALSAAEVRGWIAPICADAYGKHSRRAILSLVLLAQANLDAGRVQKALTPIADALQAAQVHASDNQDLFVQANLVHAQAESRLGNLADAIRAQDRAAQHLARAGEHQELGRVLQGLSHMQLAAGQDAAALNTMANAVTALQHGLGEWHPMVADGWDILAQLQQNAGQHQAAAASTRAARKIRDEAYYGQDASGVETVIAEVARLADEGDNNEAERLAWRGLKHALEVFGGADARSQLLRDTLIRFMSERGDVERAFDLAYAGLQDLADAGGGRPYIQALLKAAELASNSVERESEAEKLLRAALREAERSSEGRLRLTAARSLATELSSLERNQEAIGIYEELIRLQAAILGPSDPELVETLLEMSSVQLALGDRTGADASRNHATAIGLRDDRTRGAAS